MKVTIEGTDIYGGIPYPTVSIAALNNDVSVEEALDMVKRALVAWGFSWDQVFDDKITSGNRTKNKKE